MIGLLLLLNMLQVILSNLGARCGCMCLLLLLLQCLCCRRDCCFLLLLLVLCDLRWSARRGCCKVCFCVRDWLLLMHLLRYLLLVYLLLLLYLLLDELRLRGVQKAGRER